MIGLKRSWAEPPAKWMKKQLLDRIKEFEDGIAKCREYLETGRNADWSRFRPLFTNKFKDGNEVPPHPDWVRNWVLPNLQRALRENEKYLERLSNEQ